ncbi:MAG: LysM peptidoglycan-binding domain-containing protein [Bacteroidota bacterium]
MKKIIWAVVLLWLTASILGKTTLYATGDSLRYLTPQDTIFLTSDAYSQKVFTHIIEPKQTLYSLSKFYGLTLDELYFYNPKNEGGRYGVGSAIKIPIPNRSIIRFRPDDYSPEAYVPIYYVVQKGETLYHIAQRVFKMPIDTIMDRNFLLTTTIAVGHKLQIGWMSIEGVPDNFRQFRGHPLWKKSYAYRKRYNAAKQTKREYRRRGPAMFIKGAKSTTDLLVMHKYAPVGSIVQVTNPMKKRTVYAKVVAKMPKTYDANIEIVVSPRVGKMLGVIDKKFYVKTRYLR